MLCQTARAAFARARPPRRARALLPSAPFAAPVRRAVAAAARSRPHEPETLTRLCAALLTRPPLPPQPKTKWSGQEEAALVSGVKKCVAAACGGGIAFGPFSLTQPAPRYGIGKWRLIQKDPELGAVLSARSNVDLKARPRSRRREATSRRQLPLPPPAAPGAEARSPRPPAQDKWRNMHPSAESDAALARYAAPAKAKPTAPKVRPARRRARSAAAAGRHAARRGAVQCAHGCIALTLCAGARRAKQQGARAHAAHAAHGGAGGGGGAGADKKQYEKKLEDLVFEAVRTLKASATLEGIAVHIEDKYDVPPGFRKQLAAHLKSLADSGKLVKAKTAFVLPSRSAVRRSSRALCAARPADSLVCHAQAPKAGYDVKMAGYRTKGGGKVPEFLINGKRLTAEEMAEEAARAVREAEEAAAAAEAAAREGAIAEREAMDLERAAMGAR